MGAIVANLGESISKQLNSFVDLPKITVPNTLISGRAQCVDPSNDLLPRMGMERITFASGIVEMQGELGPNNERIFGVTNDVFSRIRFVGSDWTFNIGGNGQQVSGGNGINVQNYMEVVFYGTGLNLLYRAASGQDYRVTVDGGAESGNLVSTASTVIDGRNYSDNTTVNITTGLTLGLHTIKLRDNSANARWLGVEIINASGTSPNTLQMTPGNAYGGSSKYSLASLTATSFNSGFDTGTLGTKGGQAIVYLKQGGVVGKAVQPTDASQLTLTSTNHANESVIRKYSIREFGAGLTNDFSTDMTGHRAATFTLDDNTTSLVANDSRTVSSSAPESISCFSLNSYVAFTFVGTGLDIYRYDEATIGTSTLDTHTVYIDGVSLGTLSGVSYAGYTKIVSGLPYGTHLFQIKRTGGVSNAGIGVASFVTYGPTKPTAPSGAIELGAYYLPATYALGSYVDAYESASTGIIRKTQGRELFYSGSWSISQNAGDVNGQQVFTGTNGDYVQYVFYGTGFEWRYSSTTVSWSSQITIDGSTNFTTSNASPTNGAGWTGALTTGTYGNLTSFTASTGTVVANSDNLNGKSVSITGLNLGMHTVRITKTAGATNMIAQGFDIVTPIHSPKSNVPGDYQSTLTIGNQSIGDSRNFASITVPTLRNWAQALGVTTSTLTTTISTLVPVPDLTVTVKTTGNPIEIAYSINTSNNSTGVGTFFQVYVDGTAVGQLREVDQPAASGGLMLLASDSFFLPVAAGVHIVQVYWGVTSGTGNLLNGRRDLKVREI